jgi:arylsulfatase A-like enzyme
MKRTMTAHFAPFLSICVLGLACSPQAPTKPTSARNVILICLDTVRADHLGTYGQARPTSPNLDALASRALVFADASATAGWTKPSVPSFLTGTYPAQHGVYEGSAHGAAGAVTDLLPASALTLAEVFQQNGYRTGAFVHNAQLRAGNGFEQGFDSYAQESWDAREIRWHGLDWIDRCLQAKERKPFFLYLHFLDAHWPYPAPMEWITRFATAAATERFRGKDSKVLYESINDGVYAMTPADRAALEALYDGAIAYLDSELGRLFDALELRRLQEDTVVCVVADHGEEFGEHSRVGHGHGLWENLLRVPWILSIPGRAPERVATPVSLIDLFPTLLSAAALPIPPGLEGIDRLQEPNAVRAIFAEHKAPDRYFQSLREANQKLVRRFTPPLGAAPSAAAGTPPPALAAGQRWEAEVERREGSLHAKQMKPRPEALTDPPELKGPIEGLTASAFRIAGFEVRYDSKTRMQTDVGTSGPALAEGLVVKARGPLQNGVMQADRVKFYPPGESAPPELRGTLEAVELTAGAGHVVLSGLQVDVTPETKIEGVDTKPPKRRLTRKEIGTLIEGGASAFATANQYDVTRELFDLGGDRGELTPNSAPSGARLDARLDELGVALSKKRSFGTGDQKALDPEALRALQDIGYAGDH